MVKYLFALLILIGHSYCNTTSVGNINNEELLCSKDSFKIWDAKIGRNAIFYKKGFFREFDYVKGKRVYATYGDVIMDTINFKLYRDTLVIDEGQKYLILKLTEDTLDLLDYSKNWGVDTLHFFKSSNQTLLPTDHPPRKWRVDF